jgi:hypothetical protein
MKVEISSEKVNILSFQVNPVINSPTGLLAPRPMNPNRAFLAFIYEESDLTDLWLVHDLFLQLLRIW